MKDLTPSIYTFEKLILGNYLYIDKTEYLWQLVRPANGIYFLSRPRRFGKSLTLSTLKAIFQGKRELFKGTAIDSKPYDWKQYPVIHFSLNGYDFSTSERLEESLCLIISAQAEAHGIVLERSNPSAMFQKLITGLCKEAPVVLLVDEYDKPLLDNLSSPDADRILRTLKTFFSVIKDRSNDFRFVFVTGVTKFCHVSLFSDLNNLQDISRTPQYATLLGYTQEELESHFDEHLALAQQKQDLSREELLRRLKLWYDGYRFAPGAETIYNPVSIANFFLNDGQFENYWFSTGTASSLFSLMRKDGANLPDIMEKPVTGDLFDSFEMSMVDIQKLMYQTGYLTIGETETVDAGTENEERLYHLRFPNSEVRRSFNNQVMEHYAGLRPLESGDLTRRLVAEIRNGDVDAFMNRLKTLFAKIPYNLHGRQERDYQTILFVVFLMLRVSVAGEYHTNEGRIDLVLSAEKWTYVIELKLNRSALEAITQIEHKDYARGFLGQGRRVMAVGVNFDDGRAQIDNWLSEEVTE